MFFFADFLTLNDTTWRTRCGSPWCETLSRGSHQDFTILDENQRVSEVYFDIASFVALEFKHYFSAFRQYSQALKMYVYVTYLSKS